jgi:hypothetical protein
MRFWRRRKYWERGSTTARFAVGAATIGIFIGAGIIASNNETNENAGGGATTTTSTVASTTTTTVPGGTDGATLVGIPAGSEVCPGGADEPTSPYDDAPTLGEAQAEWGGHLTTVVSVPAGNNQLIFFDSNYQPDGPDGDSDPEAASSIVTTNTVYYFEAGTHTLYEDTGTHPGAIYHQYGAKDGDVFVGAPGAILDGSDIRRYAFSGSGDNVHIEYLKITDFNTPNDEGTMHPSGDGWEVRWNNFESNHGGAVLTGNEQVTQYNCFKDNGQYGLQGCCGAGADPGGSLTNLVVDSNEFDHNDADNIMGSNPGCGCFGATKFWDVRGADITNNYVHDNLGPGFWADTNNVGFNFEGNYIADNAGQGIFYEISYNFRIVNNLLEGNAWVAGEADGGFPQPAIYISESGSDTHAGVTPDVCGVADPVACDTESLISHNTIVDNWSGVVLWENANRFCGSIGNTSTAYCTLETPYGQNQGGASPGTDNLTYCNNANIGTSGAPNATRMALCRWNTQNVTVEDNLFTLVQANVTDCNQTFCGYNGIFSQSGDAAIGTGSCGANCNSYSDSPFVGEVVEDAVAFDQSNTFQSNTYTTASYWCFMSKEQGDSITFSTWQGSPYNQDAGSTYSSPRSPC